MKNYWMAGAAALAMTTCGAVAQTNAPEPTMATNGPAGTVERAHAGTAVNGAGVATGESDTFKKTQSYGSGDGELSAHTKIQATGPATPSEK
jgi:hypothetical protein